MSQKDTVQLPTTQNLDAFGKLPSVSTREMDKDREADVNAKVDIKEASKRETEFTD